MARIELLDAALADLERIVRHLLEHESPDALSRSNEIVVAIEVLRDSPNIGRHIGGGRRELVIGRETRGYLVLYRHIVQIDTILIMAIRSQREAGYRHE